MILNVNGVFVGRAVVAHRLPRGRTFIHHAQERCINMPMSLDQRTPRGTHNSLYPRHGRPPDDRRLWPAQLFIQLLRSRLAASAMKLCRHTQSREGGLR